MKILKLSRVLEHGLIKTLHISCDSGVLERDKLFGVCVSGRKVVTFSGILEHNLIQIFHHWKKCSTSFSGVLEHIVFLYERFSTRIASLHRNWAAGGMI